MIKIFQTTAQNASIGLLALRVVTGLIFIMHGGQKVFVFGFDGVSAAFAGMGIPMAGLLGPFVALLELLGGFALVVGVLTRLVSFGLAATMVVAILQVHLAAGFFMPNGYEFALTLLGSSLALVAAGAGSFSIDALIARSLAVKAPPKSRTSSELRAAA